MFYAHLFIAKSVNPVSLFDVVIGIWQAQKNSLVIKTEKLDKKQYTHNILELVGLVKRLITILLYSTWKVILIWQDTSILFVYQIFQTRKQVHIIKA